MRVFISGGCKNGKSTYAEKMALWLARDQKPLYYVATMRPADDEDRERIMRHRQSRRGLGFETIELATDIARLTQIGNPKGTFLLDSVTALLANEMFALDGRILADACLGVADGLAEILRTVDHAVIVSDYIYSDAAVYDKDTERYRKGLAYIDRCCAAACDAVIEVCYGNLMIHKGEALIGGFYETIA